MVRIYVFIYKPISSLVLVYTDQPDLELTAAIDRTIDEGTELSGTFHFKFRHKVDQRYWKRVLLYHGVLRL